MTDDIRVGVILRGPVFPEPIRVVLVDIEELPDEEVARLEEGAETASLLFRARADPARDRQSCAC